MMDPKKAVQVTEHVHVELSYGPRTGIHRMEVMDIGDEDLVLGVPWIDRAKVTLKWEPQPHVDYNFTIVTGQDRKIVGDKPYRPSKTTLEYYARYGMGSQPQQQLKMSQPQFSRALQVKVTESQPQSSQGKRRRRPKKRTQGGQEKSQPQPQRVPEVKLISARVFRQLAKKEVTGVLRLSQPQFSQPQIHPRVSTAQITTGTGRKSQITDEIKEHVPKEFWPYSDVFSKEQAMKLPPHRKFDHKITLVEGATPPHGPLYALSPVELDVLKKYLDEMQEIGFIRPSQSPAAAPILFVKKKDGSLRLCVDYRGLNNVTVKNRYPLPLISELLNRLGSAKFFSRIDLRNAYHQIRIAEGEEWKTAFRCRYGLFEYLVMPFGLTNAPATFQYLVNTQFHDMIDDFVIVFLDDIMIFSKTREEHTKHIQRVLQRLREGKLYAKAEKCEFYQKKTEFLGYVISADGISMDEKKVNAILEWPEPKNLNELRSFLGFCNYYRHFIRGYSRIVLALTESTKTKDAKPFQFTDRERLAFEDIKEAFRNGDILHFADLTKPYTVETDASDSAIGAILSQLIDGRLVPIAFFSRKLLPAEQNYEIHDKELLAIVSAFHEWRQYLEGAQHPITIVTDHQPLVYFNTKRQLTRRQARWMLFLTSFVFEITYRPGKKGEKPDALSRRPDYEITEEDRQHNYLQLLSLPTASLLRLGSTKINTLVPTLVNDIVKAQKTDEYCIVKNKTWNMSNTDREQHWTRQNGTFYYDGKIFVPAGQPRLQVLQLCHDNKLAGHPGRRKTLDLVQRHFWWPTIRSFVNHFVASCESCQRNKIRRHKPYGLLRPLPIPELPWHSVTMDFIETLPDSDGYNSIIVFVDKFTKMAIFEPCRNDITTLDLAYIFLKNVLAKHGIPSTIVSDRGSKFTSAFWRDVCTTLGIDRRLSTAAHPQTDGQTERVNALLEEYLRAYVDHLQTNWAELLPLAEFAYNNSAHSSLGGKSPFFVNFGFNPRFSFDTPDYTPGMEAKSYLDVIFEAREQVKQSLQEAQENHRKYYDRKHAPGPRFKPGDRVGLDTRNLSTQRPMKKFDVRYIGPIEVEQVLSPVTYRVKLPKDFHIHNVFHVN
ncbi:unnamed protein product [Cutaneotrichosporon oleaginosum]